MPAKKKTETKPRKATKTQAKEAKKTTVKSKTKASKKAKTSKPAKEAKEKKKAETTEVVKKTAKKATKKKATPKVEKKAAPKKTSTKKATTTAKKKPATKKSTAKSAPKKTTKAATKKKKAAPETDSYVTESGLKQKSKAPLFTLPASTGMKISLKEIKGERVVVLFFYPKDDTPGSALQAKDFQKFKDEFATNGAILCGISGDTMESHEEFAEQNGLTFPLLVDKDFRVAKKYGIYGEKTLFGQSFFGITRTTFVIGKNGRILKIFPNVKIKGHVAKVVEYIKDLNSK